MMKRPLKNTLKIILMTLSGGNCQVLGVMLISSVFVILVKVLGPLEIHWDFSLQIEAAHRLIQGLGLTNTFSSQLDLNEPPIAETLTHYPPGLSLLVVPFLWLGIPLIATLKIAYGAATLVGWLGWAMIAARCFPRLPKARLVKVCLYILAAILPIFYTPHWTYQGTDIFLWAGVPVFLLLLVESSQHQFEMPQRRLWIPLIILAGSLFTLLMLFRYASGFLLPTALFVIGYTSFPRIKSIGSRFILFLAPSLAALSLAWLSYSRKMAEFESNEAVLNSLQTHVAYSSDPDFWASVTATLQKILSSFSNLYLLTGINTPYAFEQWLDQNPLFNIVFGLLLMGFIFCLPFVLFKQKDQIKPSKDFEILVALSFSLIAYIVFSIALAFSIAYSPLSIDRYFIPVEICLILIACGLLRIPRKNILYRRVPQLFLAAFLLSNLVLEPTYYVRSVERPQLDDFLLRMTKVVYLGYQLADIEYPSNELLPFHRDALKFIASLEPASSATLFFMQDYPHYRGYANFEDPAKFRRIHDAEFWPNAFLSKDTKIYWVVHPERCPSVCASRGNFNSDDPEAPLPFVASLPNLETIFVSSNGDAAIRVSDLPAGYRFTGK